MNPERDSLWRREPVRVTSAAFLIINGLNAMLLGIGAYDGGAAAAVTGFIAVCQSAINELFTRNEVVPLRPLNRLVATTQSEVAEAGAVPPDGPGAAPAV